MQVCLVAMGLRVADSESARSLARFTGSRAWPLHKVYPTCTEYLTLWNYPYPPTVVAVNHRAKLIIRAPARVK